MSGFCWNYKECTQKFLWICTKQELKTDKIEVEFKDKVQAKKLMDMNFIFQVRVKPL
jgi:predicted metal-dependent TIM-barrel fold hydrolase